MRSERFRELWGRHDVRPKRRADHGVNHPLLGPLGLRSEKLAMADADGQSLIVYHAEPGSPSAQALALLASAIADTREPVR